MKVEKLPLRVSLLYETLNCLPVCFALLYLLMNSFIFMISVLQNCMIMTTAILCFSLHIHSPLAIDLILSFPLHFKIQISLVNCIHHIRLTSTIRICIILHIGQLIWAHLIPVFSRSWYDTSHRAFTLSH